MRILTQQAVSRGRLPATRSHRPHSAYITPTTLCLVQQRAIIGIRTCTISTTITTHTSRCTVPRSSIASSSRTACRRRRRPWESQASRRDYLGLRLRVARCRNPCRRASLRAACLSGAAATTAPLPQGRETLRVLALAPRCPALFGTASGPGHLLPGPLRPPPSASTRQALGATLPRRQLRRLRQRPRQHPRPGRRQRYPHTWRRQAAHTVEVPQQQTA